MNPAHVLLRFADQDSVSDHLAFEFGVIVDGRCSGGFGLECKTVMADILLHGSQLAEHRRHLPLFGRGQAVITVFWPLARFGSPGSATPGRQ